ncbi:phosphate ABC transporter, periplasmic phosphate-binding domain protein, partial [Vibrio parahaemolyticus VP2007-007]
RAPVVV